MTDFKPAWVRRLVPAQQQSPRATEGWDESRAPVREVRRSYDDQCYECGKVLPLERVECDCMRMSADEFAAFMLTVKPYPG